MSTSYATYTFPDGTHCYSGPNCQKHASQIAALSAVNSVTDPESFERAVQAEVAAPVVPLAKGLKPREIPTGEPRKFSDLLRSGDKGSRVVTSVDLATPPGYFVASVKMLGITTEYLIDGTEGDLHAPVVGRIELYKGRGSIYRGSELKGGNYLGQIGGTSDKTFSDAFDDIVEPPAPLPVAPASTPSVPDGADAYNLADYTAGGISILHEPHTNGEFKKAVKQLRSEKIGVRVVRPSFNKNQGHFDQKPVVSGPANGTPLVVDLGRTYPNLEVVGGNVVINAEGVYGGGITVRSGAAVTIITPPGKFTIEVDPGAAVTVYPREGAWGGVWSEEGSSVTIDNRFNHELREHKRKR